jgi:zinc transport system substrate-binding protein
MKRLGWLSTVVGLSAAVAVLGSLHGCGKAKDPWGQVEGGKLKVLVSFPPLYCFTKAVADKDAKVETLLSATGPHEHQATASDAHLASGANLFIVNGLGLDDFVTKVADSSGNRSIKIVKIADKALPESKRLHMEEEEHGKEHHHDKDHAKDKEPAKDQAKDKDHDHDKDHPKDKDQAKDSAKDKDHDHDKDHAKDKDKDHAKAHDHEHGEWDPHVWLGIEPAILMVETIRDTLKEADPDHKADYDRRAASYVEELKKLHADGKKMLEGKKNRKLIAQHDSLHYFCKSFDLDLIDSIMPQPGIEADNKKLAELVEICKKENVRVIAVEPQYPQAAAKTLVDTLAQKGHELTIVIIDPMETAPRDKLSAAYYLEVMRGNLDNLAKKMQ